MPVQISRRLLSVEDYHRMGEEMILDFDEKVELIKGEIFNKFSKSPRHANARSRLTRILLSVLENKAYVRVQGPLQIGQYSEPEPDISLLKLPSNQYVDAHPFPQDVYLLIEIADLALNYLKQIKLPLYAEANIPIVWIVNLSNNEIIEYRNPHEKQYLVAKTFPAGSEIELPNTEELIPVNKVLGL